MHNPYLYVRDRALRPGDTVVVVGATGLLGRAVAAVCVAEGLRVVAVSRTPPPDEVLPPTCVHVAIAASAVPAWLAGSEGQQLVAPESPLGLIDVLSEAEEATCALLDALDGRLGRFVALSSASVLGPGAGERRYREADPPAPATDVMQAKLRVEQAVRAAAEQRGVGATCLRLAYPYGPGHGPLTPLGRNRELFACLQRHDPVDWITPGVLPALQPLWSGDVAWSVHALLTRAERPRPLYHAAGPRAWAWDDYLGALSASVRSHSPVRSRSIEELLGDAGAAGHWLRHYLPTAPLLDDSRLRQEVYACRTELSEVVGHWSTWALSGLG